MANPVCTGARHVPALFSLALTSLFVGAVATAQEAQISEQQTALNVQQSRLLDAVSLIGDMGGGWSDGDLGKP